MVIAPMPSWVESVVKACRGHLETGSVGLVEPKELAGKIRPLSESHFARCGAQALRELHAYGRAVKEGRLDKGMRSSLEWLCDYLPAAKPRSLECFGGVAPATASTHEASEQEAVTLGGCVFESGFLPEALVQRSPLRCLRGGAAT